ncbi:ATP-dependent helicase [Candidatus Woesearchaeota archaeon]|nr:ATP-dependent helicase [Candidatus Woesearchaeota archaeon]
MIRLKEEPNSEQEIRRVLHPLVSQWFFSKFKEFSLPQLFGVLEIHSRNNILVSAPTGSTKTLTAFLSILNELIDASKKGILQDKIYCVYISPLKALNNDILKNLIEPLGEMEKINGEELGIRVAVRTGDTSTYEKSKMLHRPPHILITTPESLAIALSSIKFKEHLTNVDWCIIDEIHALAENKRGVHLSLSMERLQRLSQGMCRVGLSATIAPLMEVANFLVGEGRTCKIVDVQFLKKLDLKVISPVPDLIEISYEELNKKMYTILDELIQQHKTTLIFTNTRSGTERVVHHLKTKFPKKYTLIEEGPPTKVSSLIGAHHGSLSKELRLQVENALKNGELKACVSSTSLELGIDIGYIDLVVLLGSPKSVARAMQRQGRSGHKLYDTTKGRIIVLDRDALVECSVLLKDAVEKKIDRIHIPTNCLDVLAQQIFGIAIENSTSIEEIWNLAKKSYCFKNLKRKDFDEIIDYLAGEYTKLEDRYIYAKIWHKEGMIGRKSKMGRLIYMSNIGTIPDETGVKVKVGEQTIGTIDEGFLEKLRRGDIFVLGGDVYEFKFARGMVAQVGAAAGKTPTVPSWWSEMLPLSFDLAMDIQRFRKLMAEKFGHNKTEKEILEFINQYLYVDDLAAKAVYNYFKEQYKMIGIPSENNLIIEQYTDEKGKKFAIFHTLFGRRVNDVLSRALAFAISRSQHKDVEIRVTDNGFYVSAEKKLQVLQAFKLIKPQELEQILQLAIRDSEILRRRFRHCAGRAMMILRSYKGKKKGVGRQQVSSMLLLNAVRRISEDFPILKEAKREVLEDAMDIVNAKKVLEMITENKIAIKEVETLIPSPFAFNIVLEGYTDIMKIDDKQEFLRKMHTLVLAKIGIKG